jgi:DNA-binding phage protein
MTKVNRPVDPNLTEAEEHLLIDYQILLHETIVSKNINRSELANKAGMSKARLSQLMRPEANPTIKTMARLFHALGEELSVAVKQKAQDLTPVPEKPGKRTEGRLEPIYKALARLGDAAAEPWNWTNAPHLAPKVDDAQFVALLKEAAKESAASNDNRRQVVVMESDLMMTLEAA